MATITGNITPQQIERTRGLADLLTGQALQGGPIQSPLQGLGQLAQAFAARTLIGRANRQETARQGAANQALQSLFGGGGVGGGGAQTASAGAPGAAGATTPSLEALAGIGQQFPELSGIVNPLISARLTPSKGVVVGPGGQLLNPVSGAVIGGTPAADPKLQLREIADPNSPTGTRLVSLAEAQGQPGPPKSEFRLETITDPDGQTRTILVRGTPKAGDKAETVSKPTAAKLEQSIVTATDQLARIGQVRENLNTEFLKLPEQIKQRGLAAFEKLGGTLSPENRASLKRFTKFKTSTLRNMNRLLNELSGAAISPQEAIRLKGELPNTGDSATQFIGKVEDIENSIQAAIRRNQGLLESGVTNLEFDKRGEIIGGPDLDTFILDELRAGETAEAGMGPGAAAAPAQQGSGQGEFGTVSNNDLVTADVSAMTPEQQAAWIKELDARGL